MKTHLNLFYKVWGILRGITLFHTFWHTLIPNVIITLTGPPESILSFRKPTADLPLQAHPVCKLCNLQTSDMTAKLYRTTYLLGSLL